MAASAIPMTQLGERSFNHSAGNDAEAEYDRLRDLARQEAAKRNSCFDRSHQAYERGDGAGAKALSEEGKRHAAAMDDYNRQASDFIFRENNGPGRVAADTIDLHGQFVEEAERILADRIAAAQAQGQTHLHVIVGKGHHSANHVQKIKPAVEALCRERGLQFATEENEGRLYVDLQGGAVHGGPPPLPPQPAGHLGGYSQQHHGGGHGGHGGHHAGGTYAGAAAAGGGGAGAAYQPPQGPYYAQSQNQYHGGQYQGGQYQGGQYQQQQPNQQDQLEQQLEQAAIKCLPRLFKGCCVVM